ncbi:MAG TPA: chloride channel protein [Pirellulales bacterium]|jgi:H+/Cl- antiporter ClcA|nr:chloride channel protein [Pirellulales bacterium]
MGHQGDFNVNRRLVFISAMAILIGAVCSFVAVGLLALIRLFTNIFFFQTISLTDHIPAENTLGLWVILVPAVGGLIVGLMARYGSNMIRGHGIPEAMEVILFGRSRVQPKVAVLKPLSAAISVGSGGPFGAEGPIIMTGGAFGSIIAQLFRLTSAERKTLLVAGAAGGMTATYATPLASIMLAVELLLFEWKPRSLIPVSLACATAAVVRPFLLGTHAPLMVVHPHAVLEISALLSSVALGVAAGIVSILLTVMISQSEDLFHRLPIHWMWWPTIGGLCVGIGGYFSPRALGIGADIIDDLLHGHYVPQALVGLLAVKATIWALSLASGTSGGVLAPLFIMGGALGAMLSHILPGGDQTLWPLVGMAAVLGGSLRSPLTGMLFALELTYDMQALPAILIATAISCGISVLLLRRSMMTEKFSRDGRHTSSEFEVDPLEPLSIGEVMSAPVVTVPATMSVKQLMREFFLATHAKRHQGYPVVDQAGRLLGVLTRSNLLEDWVTALLDEPGSSRFNNPDFIIAYDLLHRESITAYPWESCRSIALRMAEYGVGRLPVVDPDDPGKIVGIVTRSDLLKARHKLVEAELKQERFLSLPRGRKNGAKVKPGQQENDPDKKLTPTS